MKRREDRRLCALCRKRKAKFSYDGKVKCDRQHDLCFRCFRSLATSQAVKTMKVETNMVFVFGSNTEGIHGAGAAKFALQHHGANFGQGHGKQGNSYAIATRTVEQGNPYIVDLPFDAVKANVAAFIEHAKANPQDEFQVTQIGTGHAGFTVEQMAPLFLDAPDNCLFDSAWEPWLGPKRRYWGTF